jgi:hypothetical protein
MSRPSSRGSRNRSKKPGDTHSGNTVISGDVTLSARVYFSVGSGPVTPKYVG